MATYPTSPWTSSLSGNLIALAVVEMVDEDGNLVDNAMVSGVWSKAVNADQAGITTSNGTVMFTSLKQTGTAVPTTETVSAAGYSHHS